MQRTQFCLAVFAAIAALTLAACGEQKKPEPVVVAPAPPPPPCVDSDQSHPAAAIGTSTAQA